MINRLNEIIQLVPGESFDFTFDQPIELQYQRFYDEEPIKFECFSLYGWYWDEDDHCCCDFYFHGKDSSSWICKEYDLLKESHDKIKEIIISSLLKDGTIKIDNGIIKRCYN